MTGCTHYEDMDAYNDDAQIYEEPWLLWECGPLNGEWFDLIWHPVWCPTTVYRRKPQTQKIGSE